MKAKAIQEEKEKEDKDKQHTVDDFLKGHITKNLVNYGDKDDNLQEGTQPPLNGVHLRLPTIDPKSIVCRRNVITSKAIFSKDPIV